MLLSRLKRILFENYEKHHVTAFMRAQPPTKGHEQVINKINESLDFNRSEDRHVFGDLYEQIQGGAFKL